MLLSDDEVRGCIARLAAAKVTDLIGNFKLRQQAVGWTYREHCLLQDPELVDTVHPVSQYAHDPMHCIAANGVANVVIFATLNAISQECFKN